MADLPRLAAWTVPVDEIDHIDHMGTAFYAFRVEGEARRLAGGLFGGAGALASEGLRLMVADRHTHYRKEQRLGAPLALEGGVTSVGEDRIGVYMQMVNTETSELAAMFTLQVEARATATGAPAALPMRRLERRADLIEPPARSGPRSLSAETAGARLTLGSFRSLGIEPHIREEIGPEICDAEGYLRTVKPRFVADGHIPTVGVMAQVWNCAAGHFWPMIEQRDIKLRIPRAGDVLETYEAMLKVDPKAIHSANWLFEVRSGALTEVRHMVTVFFSAATRRSVSLPPDLRERFAALARPQLLSDG